MAAATTYGNPNVLVRRGVDWGAVWAGVFTFVAVWSVFGLLGAAIFSTAANPDAARPVTGMGIGMSIWAIVLTIIAMYVAGLETGRLAEVANRHEGVTHGMAMFGLSVLAALVVIVLGGTSLSGATGADLNAHSPYALNIISGLGWAGFLSLFFGWLAAMGGAATGMRRTTKVENPVQPIRKAA
jgi:hypothetical protein